MRVFSYQNGWCFSRAVFWQLHSPCFPFIKEKTMYLRRLLLRPQNHMHFFRKVVLEVHKLLKQNHRNRRDRKRIHDDLQENLSFSFDVLYKISTLFAEYLFSDVLSFLANFDMDCSEVFYYCLFPDFVKFTCFFKKVKPSDPF